MNASAHFDNKRKYESQARRLTDHYRKNMINAEGYTNPHLDHIVSIDFGFEHNIPVDIICLPENLTWVEKEENLGKGSSLTKEGISLLKKWFAQGAIDNPIGSLKERVAEAYSFDEVYEKLRNSKHGTTVVEELPTDIALNLDPVWCQRREDLRWEKTKRAMGRVALMTHRMMMCCVYPDGRIERLDGNTRSYIFKNNLQFSDYEVPDTWHVTFFSVKNKEEAERLYHSIDSSDTAENFAEKLGGYMRARGYGNIKDLPAKMHRGELVYDIAVIVLDNYIPEKETEAVSISYTTNYADRASETAEKLDYFIKELVALGKVMGTGATPQMLTSPIMAMLIRYMMVDDSDKVFSGIQTIVEALRVKKDYHPWARSPMIKGTSEQNLYIMIDELQTSDSINRVINYNVPELEATSRRILPERVTATTKNVSDRRLYCGWIAYCFDKYLRDEVMDEDIIFDVTGKKILPSTPNREAYFIRMEAESKIMQEYDNFWKTH